MPDVEESGADDAGAADVGFKRKAEDNQIFLWKGLPLTNELVRKNYDLDQEAMCKNEATGMKMIKGAEAAGVKAKGLAEAAGIKVKDNEEAFVKKTNANTNAIKIEAEAKKTEAEAKKTKADAKKTIAETKLLEFDLAQKQKAAYMTTGAEKTRTPSQEAVLQKRRDKYARDRAAKGGKLAP